MCGIVGYISSSGNGIELILNSLSKVLYRGYDSIGAAFVIDGAVNLFRKAKTNSTNVEVEELERIIKSANLNGCCHLGIGHSRWATRGAVTDANAHPHADMTNQFFVVHNGNVENFLELKDHLLKRGVIFYSETDTEVIANLIAQEYHGDLEEAIQKSMGLIVGANAVLVMSPLHPDCLVAANCGGSILICQYDGGMIVASDPAAFLGKSSAHVALDDYEIAVIRKEGAVIREGGEIKEKEQIILEKLEIASDIGNFRHYMEKEIFSQPEMLENAISGRIDKNRGNSRLGGIDTIKRDLRNVNTFHFVGCGTAYNACAYGELLFNRFGIPARSWIASEFCYRHPVFEPNDAFIFVSQSGETADTIGVLDEIKTKGNVCLGIVNKRGTKISRQVDAGCNIRAGLEIGVASTKAFLAQLVNIALLAVFLARQRKMTIDTGQRIIDELSLLPEKSKAVLAQAGRIEALAHKYRNYGNYYFLGRYFNLIVAQEGALKLKEISYAHAESYPLGEMKHGPLALVSPEFVNVVVAPKDTVFSLSLVNIDEIKARLGPVIAVTSDGEKIDADDVIRVPETLDFLSPILTTIPLQLFAYYMALVLGRNPDMPRNLAKSVTVV